MLEPSSISVEILTSLRSDNFELINVLVKISGFLKINEKLVGILIELSSDWTEVDEAEHYISNVHYVDHHNEKDWVLEVRVEAVCWSVEGDQLVLVDDEEGGSAKDKEKHCHDDLVAWAEYLTEWGSVVNDPCIVEDSDTVYG